MRNAIKISYVEFQKESRWCAISLIQHLPAGSSARRLTSESAGGSTRSARFRRMRPRWPGHRHPRLRRARTQGQHRKPAHGGMSAGERDRAERIRGEWRRGRATRAGWALLSDAETQKLKSIWPEISGELVVYALEPRKFGIIYALKGRRKKNEQADSRRTS